MTPPYYHGRSRGDRHRPAPFRTPVSFQNRQRLILLDQLQADAVRRAVDGFATSSSELGGHEALTELIARCEQELPDK